MKNCTDCKNAKWKRTATGRLHQSGDGRCTWELSLPVLPVAFFWSGWTPKIAGGIINRKTTLKDHRPHWARDTKGKA